MAVRRGNARLEVGSAPWIADERTVAFETAEGEAEEFMYSMRNDVEWLNEHMAEIFSQNHINVAEMFKTPGKLRGKTPRTIRRAQEARAPLSDIFSASPRVGPSPFRQIYFERPAPTFQVAEDHPLDQPAAGSSRVVMKQPQSPPPMTYPADSGYHGSQPDEATQSTQPFTQPSQPLILPVSTAPPPKVTQTETPSESEAETENDDENVVIANDGSEQSSNHNSSFTVALEASPRTLPTYPQGLHSERTAAVGEADDTFRPILTQYPNGFEPFASSAQYYEKDTQISSFTQAASDVIAKEAQAEPSNAGESAQKHQVASGILEKPLYPSLEKYSLSSDAVQTEAQIPNPLSPTQHSPGRGLNKELPPVPESTTSPPQQDVALANKAASEDEDEPMEDVQSPTSENSSPIRPVVRKSSLNFASLPAREPITTKKSIGNRTSRTSHLEQTRTSYYGRHTGGKSLGNPGQHNVDDDDEMDVDESSAKEESEPNETVLHNKTSTQRLQDQISKLGQSQTSMRPSKSFASSGAVPLQPSQTSGIPPTETRQEKFASYQSPKQKSRPPPGAFPDDEDSWIGPAPFAVASEAPSNVLSPRPQMTKSYTTDVMEGIHKDSISGADFNIINKANESKVMSTAESSETPCTFSTAGPAPNHGRKISPIAETSGLSSTLSNESPSLAGHTLRLGRSVSTPDLKSPKKSSNDLIPRKPIAVSNPTPSISSVDHEASTTPPRSPTRSMRGSPLKAAKDKFSSILKSSRGLFASSAAVSAEAKSSALPGSSSRHVEVLKENQIQMSLHSPTHGGARKTRASTEREEKRKLEEAREVKEMKEAQKMTDQLEKARNKVKEDARFFHLEQERVAEMQKEVESRKQQEKLTKMSQGDMPRATRSSPRKTKAQLEAEGIAAATASSDELADREADNLKASQAMPPPARPKSQIGKPSTKRPLKPAANSSTQAKPATVIRVDIARGHQYHPSNSTLSATLQESLSSSQQGPSHALRHTSKASTSSLRSATSTNSLKSSVKGVPKSLEAAARKREQEEAAKQRRLEAKLDLENKRAALKDEERRKEEQSRRQEEERQRELQRERQREASAADARKAAARQAREQAVERKQAAERKEAIEKRRLEIEKAKETRAPQPLIRGQPLNELRALRQEQIGPPGPAKPRMNQALPKDDYSRPGNPLEKQLQSEKPTRKRLLQQDADERSIRPQNQLNGPTHQFAGHQSKRRRTSEQFEEEDMTVPVPTLKGPPIRQSSSRPKEIQTKSLFPSGYANAPNTGNLSKQTLISQHNMNQSKPAHPMDMAQVSKAPIPFASSSTQNNGQAHRTPGRPATQNGTAKSGKSAPKSSPRYQNGENINLPEINSDSEDEDSDKETFVRPGWAESPALRETLMRQESMDPHQIFGRVGSFNMEEVFSRQPERFSRFRARTSSANWSGTDGLTEEEVRRDLRARQRVARQGGWTYDSMV